MRRGGFSGFRNNTRQETKQEYSVEHSKEFSVKHSKEFSVKHSKEYSVEHSRIHENTELTVLL